MSSSIIADIATTVGVISAIIGLILTTRYNKNAERAAADRAENAAALSDANAQRTIAALEKIATSAASSPTMATPKAVRWALTHSKGDTFLLENIGNKGARDVLVEVAKDSHIAFQAPNKQDLQEGEGLNFFAAKTLATTDSTITVTWTEEGHDVERKKWQYPLPPRPPRRR